MRNRAWMGAMVALAGLAIPLAQAEIFRCSDAQGKPYFSDRSCPQGTRFDGRGSSLEAIRDSADQQQRLQRALRSGQGRAEGWHRVDDHEGLLTVNPHTGAVREVEQYLQRERSTPDYAVEVLKWSPVWSDGQRFRVRCRYSGATRLGIPLVRDEVFELSREGKVVQVHPYVGGAVETTGDQPVASASQS